MDYCGFCFVFSNVSNHCKRWFKTHQFIPWRKKKKDHVSVCFLSISLSSLQFIDCWTSASHQRNQLLLNEQCYWAFFMVDSIQSVQPLQKYCSDHWYLCLKHLISLPFSWGNVRYFLFYCGNINCIFYLNLLWVHIYCNCIETIFWILKTVI